MDFTQDFNFGVQETTVITNTNESPLFSNSPEEITPITTESESTEKEDKFVPTQTSDSPLFNSEEEPVTESELPKEEEEQVIEQSQPEKSPYSVFHKTLLEQGIFTSEEDEEEINTAEKFLERFQLEANKKANEQLSSFLSRFGQDKIDFFNAVFVNNVDPVEYFQIDQQIQSVRSIDLETVENQEFIISQYYKGLGWPETKIKKQLKRLEEDGETEEEAKEAHQTLLRKEEEQLQILLHQQQQELMLRQQQQQHYNNNIGAILNSKLKDKDFDGIPVTDKVAKSTLNFLTAEKWQLPTGEKLSDFDKWIMDLKHPDNYELRIKVALLAQNGFDFSKIKSKAITEKTNKLFEGLVQKEKTQERKNSINQGFTF